MKLVQAAELRTIYVGLDQASAELRSSNVKGRNPFSDRRVRQAIYQAIDIEAIRKDVMRGLSIPAGMLVAPRALGYAPELDRRLPYDPKAAKALLAEAGYPDGFSVTLDCPNNWNINDEAICRAIAAQLDEVGMDIAVNPQPKEVICREVRQPRDRPLPRQLGGIDSHVIFINFYRTRGERMRPATPIRGSTS